MSHPIIAVLPKIFKIAPIVPYVRITQLNMINSFKIRAWTLFTQHKKYLPEFNRSIKSNKKVNYNGNAVALKQSSRTSD